MKLEIVEGDLLNQDVDAIVNPWNRNFIPRWLFVPGGVSGAIRKRGGPEPFRELAKLGMIPLGGAVITGAGELPFKAIIHVAGINLFWRTSEKAIRDCTRNALHLATEHQFQSIAFPLIGAGVGGGSPETSLTLMEDELSGIDFDGAVRVVQFSGR